MRNIDILYAQFVSFVTIILLKGLKLISFINLTSLQKIL